MLKDRILIIVMSALGIGLAINPYTGRINAGLFKGTAWLVSGLISKLVK
jgi:hypothetical protein